MYKYLLIFIFLASFNSPSYAQSDQLEAKAAYLLAEESYAKGDMKSTVQYLDEAGTKLGGANAKILYLKIMAQRELANTDQNYVAKLDSTIALFQKSPDIGNFNEDKVLEVVKLKIQLKKEAEQKKIDEELKEKAKARAGISAVERDYPDWPLGASLATLRGKHPDIFKLIDDKSKDISVLKGKYGELYIIYREDIKGVYKFKMKGDKLNEFHLELYKFIDDPGNVKGKEAFAKIVEDLQGRLGSQVPKIDGVEGLRTESYIWKESTKQVFLMGNFYSTGRNSATISIYDYALF